MSEKGRVGMRLDWTRPRDTGPDPHLGSVESEELRFVGGPRPFCDDGEGQAKDRGSEASCGA